MRKVSLSVRPGGQTTTDKSHAKAHLHTHTRNSEWTLHNSHVRAATARQVEYCVCYLLVQFTFWVSPSSLDTGHTPFPASSFSASQHPRSPVRRHHIPRLHELGAMLFRRHGAHALLFVPAAEEPCKEPAHPAGRHELEHEASGPVAGPPRTVEGILQQGAALTQLPRRNAPPAPPPNPPPPTGSPLLGQRAASHTALLPALEPPALATQFPRERQAPSRRISIFREKRKSWSRAPAAMPPQASWWP